MKFIKNITANKKKLIKYIIGCCFLLFLIWVFSPARIGIMLLSHNEKEVSENERYWGGYKIDAKYNIIQSVFIEEKDMIVLVPPNNDEGLGHMLYEAPYSIESYYLNKNKWPQVVGIIDKGTTITVHKILKEGRPTWGSNLRVIAEILDGEHSGLLVDISDLSLTVEVSRGPFLLRPDPRLLIEVEQSNSKGGEGDDHKNK